jgi:hypothetical protein
MERIKLVAGDYQDCGRKLKSLLLSAALAIMGGYSQLKRRVCNTVCLSEIEEVR